MRRFRRALWTLPLLIALPAAASPLWGPLPQRERQALVDLFQATNGTEWTRSEGWLGRPGTECDWSGVECACHSAIGGPCPFVFGIELPRNNLQGRLPRSLGNLRNLRRLDLSLNRLQGPLPREIGALRKLKFLELSGNSLSGEIPPEIGKLSWLSWLNFSGNQLRGPLPAALGSLKRLQVIGLVDNQLTGEVPRWLGSLPQLVSLGLGRNRLTGTIPAELFDLASLHELGLEENRLTGQIPENIGNHDLHVALLQGNRLTGPVPTSILDLEFLSYINVDWNAVYPATPDVEQFLIDRSGHLGWALTQTLPPENLTVAATGSTSIRLEWTPVNAIAGLLNERGGYLVYAQEATEDRFRQIATVQGKETSSVIVIGLAPGTAYLFTLRAFSRPHAENENSVWSEMAEPISGTTSP